MVGICFCMSICWCAATMRRGARREVLGLPQHRQARVDFRLFVYDETGVRVHDAAGAGARVHDDANAGGAPDQHYSDILNAVGSSASQRLSSLFSRKPYWTQLLEDGGPPRLVPSRPGLRDLAAHAPPRLNLSARCPPAFSAGFLIRGPTGGVRASCTSALGMHPVCTRMRLSAPAASFAVCARQISRLRKCRCIPLVGRTHTGNLAKPLHDTKGEAHGR